MILTGSEIAREHRNGRITIEPFIPEQVNPNSYNFRLGCRLRIYTTMPLDPRKPNAYEEIEIPAEGYILEPGRLYLAHTEEVLGSDNYAPTFAARSSVARLGLFINLSASLGDIGYVGQWTLQLYTVNQLRVYPGMNIGQMMWWRPQGDIALYEGKYQGSTGPRSSDIFRDFDKAEARSRFPALGDSCDPAAVGGKFAALSAASGSFRMPSAFVVPAAEFECALDEADAGLLDEFFAELQATVGAFFIETAAQIGEVAARAVLGAEASELLAIRLRDVFGAADGRRFAVRSSGIEEDGATATLAGIYQSLLGVDADGVVKAIEECWRSYYAPPAIAARVRASDFSAQPKLAVIVQEMVDPTLAGVAFTGLDGASDNVTVEYVAGLGENLMAGAATPVRVTSADLESQAGSHRDVFDEVMTMTRRLRESRDGDVDVEWASDDAGVHLIQVRPVTVGAPPAVPLWTSRLYLGNPPQGVTLGEVAAVHAGYVAKRGPAYRLARASGVPVGMGWVVGFTGAGLREGTDELERVLAEGHGTECVLDLGDTLRQIVVSKDEVVQRLLEVTGVGGTSAGRAVIVRDFLRGSLGVISRLSDDGLVVDYTPEGLMALNRGTTGSVTLVMDCSGNVTAPDSAAPLLPHLGSVAEFTASMQAVHGDVALEWVLDGDRLFFVDYSVLGAGTLLTGAGGLQISAGTATGPLLTLEDDEMLRRMSIGPAVSIDKSNDVTGYAQLTRVLEKIRNMPEPPIVRASRPFAVLSVLIGLVSGFVFDEGSVLCHLAILLREAGVPAVASAGLGAARDGAQAVIGDGVVTVTEGNGHA